YALEIAAEGDDAILACEGSAEEPENSTDLISRDEAHTDDLLLVYLQALRSVPLLDRQGEVAVAQRVERAHMDRLIFVLERPLSAHILGAFCARLHAVALALDNTPAPPDTAGAAAPARIQAVRTTRAACTQQRCPFPGQAAHSGELPITAADAVALLKDV